MRLRVTGKHLAREHAKHTITYNRVQFSPEWLETDVELSGPLKYAILDGYIECDCELVLSTVRRYHKVDCHYASPQSILVPRTDVVDKEPCVTCLGPGQRRDNRTKFWINNGEI